jgi:hypothetical protein
MEKVKGKKRSREASKRTDREQLFVGIALG